jgi:hypothetical protein
MAELNRNFTQGKMNKSVDERLIPNGQYIDALNIRMGSTEASEIGVIENAKGNSQITTLSYDGSALSAQAKCIGAFDDGANETIYWFVNDPNFTSSNTGILDLIVSFNTKTSITTYHVISVDDGGGVATTLNFDPEYLITGIDKVEDLLFFTDNINPPRRINVTKNYSDPDLITGIDGFSDEDILVVKRPPYEAPILQLLDSGTEENFLEERFVSFAYRYKYDDNEYSATSQWTDPAFNPKPFFFSPESYLNDGAVNIFNAVEITFDTGGSLVKGIDLLFKDMNSSVIKVIEKLDKESQGYLDNQKITYFFQNSKIFTILPQAEILRLYDNVPILAKAETIMGNRLMYGNYVEGYDLIDKNDNPVRLEFTTTPIMDDLGAIDSEGGTSAQTYTIQGTEVVNDSRAFFDFSGLDLIEGAAFTFTFNFEHESWRGPGTLPVGTNGDSNVLSFSLILINSYDSVEEFVTSSEFTNLLGTSLPGGNIQPMATSDIGTTMTDAYNSLFDGTIDGSLLKYQSGISGIEQSIRVEFVSGNIFRLIFPAVQYADNLVTPTTIFTEYFTLTNPLVEYIKNGSGRSLHSNRGYEIGLIYMDEFKRSTPALVSQYNTEHFACSDADTANSIDVNIPPTQLAPAWASSYKFAIKPDKETYETIYSSIFFTEPVSNDTYFLLEGENSQKITEGQRLIVKRDTAGSARGCVYATVLEKKAQVAGFIEVPSPSDPGVDLLVPSGVYMKIKASNFPTVIEEDAYIDYGTKSFITKQSDLSPFISPQYPVMIKDGDVWVDYDIPAGTQITFDFTFERIGRGDSCEPRKYTLNKTMISSQDYDDFQAWFEGDNIELVLATGTPNIGGDGTDCEFTTEYLGTILGSVTDDGVDGPDIPISLCELYFGFWTSTEGAESKKYFVTSSVLPCGNTKKRRSTTDLRITVLRADTTVVFESEPIDASPDVWYEGSKTFGIAVNGGCGFVVTVSDAEPEPIALDYINLEGNPAQIIVNPGGTGRANGECGSMTINPSTPPIVPINVLITELLLEVGSHLGDVQNQTTTQAAICHTGFFNCYAFGNGVESYKIRDGVLGQDLRLGNRVTSTEAEDYSQVRRFSDITYSGIYNDESNINRLNEFNEGLLNFKALEYSFGPIQKLFARETDILTLQEDKISYVLQGKNLLSDAGAGNLLTTVPEVLGTQVARIEEFGISFNAESFTQWGPDKYFTDAKRGAVLKLSGTSYQNDSLEPISFNGMRTWFRDLFQTSFDTQKLGGFDPYMNEYVLSSNDRSIPTDTPCVDCGITQRLSVTLALPHSQCYELGDTIGTSLVSWTVNTIPALSTFDVTTTYNGVVQTLVGQTADGSISVNRDTPAVSEVTVDITSTASVDLTLTVNCPQQVEISLVNIVATNNSQVEDLIHIEQRYVDGTFISPLQSQQVQFTVGVSDPVASLYQSVIGGQGEGSIPTTGSTVTISTNNFGNDTFVYDPSLNSLRYLVTSTNYPNTPQQLAALIAASSVATPNLSGPTEYSATFAMPNATAGDYLYLIWDLRQSTEIDLCYGSDAESVCCINC